MKIKRHVVHECITQLDDAIELIDAKLQHDVFLRETAWKQLITLETILRDVKLALEVPYGRRKPSKRNEETWRQATAFAG
jgi:hypothetical protein